MYPRQALRPNQQVLTAVLGPQLIPYNYPKSIERPSIVTHDTPGKGQQGESVTGGSNKQTYIRKGTYRAN